MTLAGDVDLEEYIMAKDDLSGADIKVSSNLRLFHQLCKPDQTDFSFFLSSPLSLSLSLHIGHLYRGWSTSSPGEENESDQ